MFNPTLKIRKTLLYFFECGKYWAKIYWSRYCTRYVRKKEVKEGGKLENVSTGYKDQSTQCLNLLKENECRISVQIVLCIFSQINNTQKYFIQFFFMLFLLLLCLHQYLLLHSHLDTHHFIFLITSHLFCLGLNPRVGKRLMKEAP